MTIERRVSEVGDPGGKVNAPVLARDKFPFMDLPSARAKTGALAEPNKGAHYHEATSDTLNSRR